MAMGEIFHHIMLEQMLFLYGMGQFIAKEFMKRNYDIHFENWRMDLRIKGVMEKEVDGIKCIIFLPEKDSLLENMPVQ